MIIRAFSKDTDYQVVISWWEDWGHAVIPERMLPNKGLIAESDCGPFFSAFMIYTDNNMAMLEWATKKPGTSSQEVQRALASIIPLFEDMAKRDGKEIIFARVAKPTIHRELCRQGYGIDYVWDQPHFKWINKENK